MGEIFKVFVEIIYWDCAKTQVCGLLVQLSVTFLSLLQTSVCLENAYMIWLCGRFCFSQEDKVIPKFILRGLDAFMQRSGLQLLNRVRSGSWPLLMAWNVKEEDLALALLLTHCNGKISCIWGVETKTKPPKSTNSPSKLTPKPLKPTQSNQKLLDNGGCSFPASVCSSGQWLTSCGSLWLASGLP